MAAVIRGTARAYAREPKLILTATVAIVLTLWLLKLPSLSGPLTSVVTAIVSFCAVCAFVAFVLSATGGRTSNYTDDARRCLDVAQRARSVVGELALLLLVMAITAAILVGLLEFVSLIVAITVLFHGGFKSHSLLLVGLPAYLSVTTLPLLLLFTAWSVALPIAVHERPGGILPLGRSYELIRGNRLRAFAVVTLLALLVLTVNLGLRALLGADEFEGSQLSGTLAALLLAPIPLLATNALYRELERASCSSNQRLRSSPPP
ncbi:MAG: hypothetical protein ACRDK4_12030 [Solirubrobacteraceae bacterium]